jgi:uncharacterized protein (DUF924 family)
LIPTRQALSILESWFGSRPYTCESVARHSRVWFGDPTAPELRPQADEALRLRYGTLAAAAARGEFDVWESSPRRRLALILLLDQIPRGIYRGTSQAYAQDHRALSLTVSGMQLGADSALDPVERIFFYLPMQHAESPALQEESVSAFRRLAPEGPADLAHIFAVAVRHAEQHYDVIERFGRFPNRNRALGRISTAEEKEWLSGVGADFGH